jgi:hypothetical protein
MTVSEGQKLKTSHKIRDKNRKNVTEAYVHIYLFNKAVRTSDYTASNARIINGY